ncbi:hypothetical protein GCM10028805_42410 [Spirosoma harenae]
MKIFAIAFLVILVFGYLFVQWANKPENVEALKRKRAMDAARKVEDKETQAALVREQAILHDEIEHEKSGMKLVIDEDFARKGFEKLDFNYPTVRYFNFETNKLDFSGTVYRSQNPQEYFITSTEDFNDFIAEIQIGIWGDIAYAGICWDVKPAGNLNPAYYQAAYSSPNHLYVKAYDKERFGLGGFISSENNQLLRVERFGKRLKVCVNGRILFDKSVESGRKGKIGIIVGHRGGIHPDGQSISVGINHFKVWQ